MSGPVTKVRFVYCPRCRQLLTEFSDIPVYKCGGCGAVLKAKNRGDGTKSSAPRSLEKTFVKANEEGHGFKDNIPHTSSKQEILSSTDGNVSDIDSKRERTASIAKNLNVFSLPDELSCRIENTLEKNPVEGNEEGHSSEDDESVASNKQVILCLRETFVSDMDQGRELAESMDHDNNFSENRRNSNANSSTDELYCHRKKDSPTASKNGEESDGNGRRDPNSEIPHQESQLTFRKRSLTFTPQNQPDQAIQSEIANSNLNEESQNLGHCSYDQVRPRGKVEGTIGTVDNNIVSEDELIDTEIVGVRRDFSKYPTNRTSQGYNGSVSSNSDGCSEDVLHQRSHLSGRTLLKPESSYNMSNYSEEQPQARQASLMSSNESYGLGPTRGRFETQKRGNLQEYDLFNSVWNWMESGREDPFNSQYRESRYRRDPTNFYCHQNGSQSNYGHDNLLCSPSSYASDKVGSLEQDRLQLLRKVDELREKLSRSHCEREKARESFPVRGAQQGRHWPLHHFNDSEDELLRYSSSYAWHSPGVYDPRKTRPVEYRPSQMPFSGHATNHRQHIDHSFMHCYPEDRQYPVQFPACTCYNKGLCGACPGHICYHSHSHSPASSQRPIEYSQLQEQRHMDCEIDKLHFKDKRQPIKRHFLRAIAGGAPFVICYSCRKLLKLPADFLLSSRRRHRLQCGACSEVLTFWLHGKTHVFPYNTTFQVQNPVIEVDSSSDTAIRNLAVASEGDPVSCSDDYGLSFCKSYSTEEESAMLACPFPISQSSGVDKRHAANSSQELMDEKKKVSEYSGSNLHNSREVPRAVIPFPDASKTVKSSVDANVVEPINASPLHRLMGYSSPSEMINGYKIGGDKSKGSDFQPVANSYATSKDNGMSSLGHQDLDSKTLSFCNEITEEDVLSEGVKSTKHPSLPGIISKEPRDINHELENMKLKVSVNGRVIQNQFLKKAEERAGPISSGNYWYDSQAGFWGVMGQPCLGIIPPFIEEFNYPMAKDCAGGNTGILVNGRELHQEDLDLLSYKGLATTKNKTYIVKSCGQVIDEESGKEMDRLGKLAPTVERLGHGFGMHVLDG